MADIRKNPLNVAVSANAQSATASCTHLTMNYGIVTAIGMGMFDYIDDGVGEYCTVTIDGIVMPIIGTEGQVDVGHYYICEGERRVAISEEEAPL